MSGFKSFSQNTTSHANVIKAQSHEHSEGTSSTENPPSQTPDTENDQPLNNDQPDPNNK